MISAMNTDNLSCAFYSYNLVNKLLPSVAGQRDTSVDKRAILWTKATSPTPLHMSWVHIFVPIYAKHQSYQCIRKNQIASTCRKER